MDTWLSEVQVLLDDVSSSVSRSASSEYPTTYELQVPSLKDLVETQLAEENPLSLEELRVQREVIVRNLEVTKLNKHIENCRRARSVVSQRKPSTNSLRTGVRSASNLLNEPTSVILEVEVYGNRWSGFTSSVYGLESPREQLTKISTMEISATCTFGDLLTSLLETLPSRRSYEAASYANGGMLLFPVANPRTSVSAEVFVNRRGGENYCDYSQYLESSACEFFVYDMDKSEIKDHWSKLISDMGVVGYLVHTGQECERVCIHNVYVRGQNVPDVREIYRRSIRKISWCVLCGCRVAQLVVVDDFRLPLTPCFLCKDCYRSFRSDINGVFIEPEDHVGVFLFHEF